MELGELRYTKGAISEDDFLKIKLQLLQFETDYQQAELAKVQALSDLRQLLGYESVPPDYDVAGAFDYQPLKGNLEDFQLKAAAKPPRSASGATRRDCGTEPVRGAENDCQARRHRAGKLFARQRHQRRDSSTEAFRFRSSIATRARSNTRVSPSRKRKSRRKPPTARP